MAGPWRCFGSAIFDIVGKALGLPAHKLMGAQHWDKVVAEAIQMWLEKQREKKTQKGKVLQMLRQTGMVIDSEKQRASAEAMIAALPSKDEMPSQTQVEASLAKLRLPLSEEIIAMRKER
ncbi:MAG: hypothetical protein O7E52_04290 [Candidatus Poribacteria bacterium]|nr:hypothetical protein [Candidatus Poribacteria bacterium]